MGLARPLGELDLVLVPKVIELGALFLTWTHTSCRCCSAGRGGGAAGGDTNGRDPSLKLGGQQSTLTGRRKLRKLRASLQESLLSLTL